MKTTATVADTVWVPAWTVVGVAAAALWDVEAELPATTPDWGVHGHRLHSGHGVTELRRGGIRLGRGVGDRRVLSGDLPG